MVRMVYMKYWNRVHLIYIQVKGYIDLARQEGCSILCGNSTEEPQLPEKNKNVGDISNYSLLSRGLIIVQDVLSTFTHAGVFHASSCDHKWVG